LTPQAIRRRHVESELEKQTQYTSTTVSLPHERAHQKTIYGDEVTRHVGLNVRSYYP